MEDPEMRTGLLAAMIATLATAIAPNLVVASPLALMATITGTIDSNVLTFEEDVDAFSLHLQFVIVPPGRYIASSPAGDTISITDLDGNATIQNNNSSSVTVIIAAADLTDITVSGSINEDTITVVLPQHPITLASGGSSDTINILSPTIGTINTGPGFDEINILAPFIGTVTGGSHDDQILLASGVTVSGQVSGGSGIDHLIVQTNNPAATLTGSSVNGFNGTMTGLATPFQGLEEITAPNGTSASLTGRDVTASWTLGATRGYTDGTATLTFTGFDTLNGGSAADTFVLTQSQTLNINGLGGDDAIEFDANGVTLTGNFLGGAGSNTLQFNGSANQQFEWNGSALINSLVSGTLGGIRTVVGGSGVDTFLVLDNATMNFVGRGGNDAFAIYDGVTLTGSINGGGQAQRDTLTVNGLSPEFVLTGVTPDGFAGTVTYLTGGFTGIDSIQPFSPDPFNSPQLFGLHADAVWEFDSDPKYVNTASGEELEFAGIYRLTGGHANDTFNVITPYDQTHSSYQVLMYGMGGDDTATVNMANNGTSLRGAKFYGGAHGANGDSMSVINGNFSTSTAIFHLGEAPGFTGNRGIINRNGYNIVYAELEKPVVVTTQYQNLTFDFTEQPGTARFGNAPGGSIGVWSNDEMLVEFNGITTTKVTLRPPDDLGVNQLLLGPLDSTFNANLQVNNWNATNQTLQVLEPVVIAPNRSITLSADTLDVQSTVQVGGTGTVTLNYSIGSVPMLSTADAELVTVGGDITIDADTGSAAQSFRAISGSAIQSNGGDISITGGGFESAASIDAGSGVIQLFPSFSGSTFQLGAAFGASPPVEGIAGGPTNIHVDDTELGLFSSTTAIIVGDEGTSDIDLNTIDVSSSAPQLVLVSGTGTILTQGETDPDVTVPTLNIFGRMAPGLTNGKFSVNGNLYLDNGSAIRLNIGGPSPGPGFDQYQQVQVTGNISAFSDTSSILQLFLTNSYNPPQGAEFLLIEIDGANPFPGQFAGLTEGAVFMASGRQFSITYLGGDGNDVVVTALAQPSDVIFKNGFEAVPLCMQSEGQAC
jgi:fibronectin-binding autotransporter adhesin